ncbi:MAG: hypothetical protein M1840_007415 [Geoglossum simile]|nr:MAG: hypothetical protein M1840_007415 [Geoglossum simile]
MEFVYYFKNRYSSLDNWILGCFLEVQFTEYRHLFEIEALYGIISASRHFARKHLPIQTGKYVWSNDKYIFELIRKCTSAFLTRSAEYIPLEISRRDKLGKVWTVWTRILKSCLEEHEKMSVQVAGTGKNKLGGDIVGTSNRVSEKEGHVLWSNWIKAIKSIMDEPGKERGVQKALEQLISPYSGSGTENKLGGNIATGPRRRSVRFLQTPKKNYEIPGENAADEEYMGNDTGDSTDGKPGWQVPAEDGHGFLEDPFEVGYYPPWNTVTPALPY